MATASKSVIHTAFTTKDGCDVCNICDTSLKRSKSASTTQLWNHLKRFHPSKHDDLQNQKVKRPKTKAPSESSFNCANSAFHEFYKLRKCSEAEKERYDKAILQFIAKDGRSFEMVAGEGFQNLVKELTNSSYVPPHPTTLSRSLGDLTENARRKLRENLENRSDRSFSLTFDHYKAKSGKDFLVVMVHYLTEDRKSLATHLLDAFALAEHQEHASHGAEDTAALVKQALKNFNLEMKDCIACTTDTTNTMPCAVIKILKMDWMPCHGHVLQLAMNASLGCQVMVKRLLSWCHKIAGFLHSSLVGDRILKKYQQLTNIPLSRPPMDVKTRWNSTLELMEWVFQNLTAVKLTLSECQTSSCRDPPKLLPDEHLALLMPAIRILKPVSEATTALSQEKEPTSNITLPTLRVMVQEIENMDSSGLKTFKDVLLQELKNRVNFKEKILMSATMMDPRFKATFMDADDVKLVIDYLSSLYDRLYVDSEEGQDNLKMIPDESQGASTTQERPDSLLGKALLTAAEIHVPDTHDQNVCVNVHEEIEKEVKTYLDLPLESRNVQPLKYWAKSNNGHGFKRIPKLAGLLTVQSTNTSSERTNSVGTFIINHLRCSLSGSSSEKLIFAKRNSDLVF